MSNRDLSRRLVRLEADRSDRRIRYTVSDRILSDADWLADLAGDADGPLEEMSPILTEADWIMKFADESVAQ